MRREITLTLALESKKVNIVQEGKQIIMTECERLKSGIYTITIDIFIMMKRVG